jgi:hypothetical protein
VVLLQSNRSPFLSLQCHFVLVGGSGTGMGRDREGEVRVWGTGVRLGSSQVANLILICWFAHLADEFNLKSSVIIYR